MRSSLICELINFYFIVKLHYLYIIAIRFLKYKPLFTTKKYNRLFVFRFYFIILAKKTPSSRSVKGHSPVSRWEM
ncbi:hypothetical protein COK91_29970, partial [Bacillus cereus]